MIQGLKFKKSHASKGRGKMNKNLVKNRKAVSEMTGAIILIGIVLVASVITYMTYSGQLKGIEAGFGNELDKARRRAGGLLEMQWYEKITERQPGEWVNPSRTYDSGWVNPSYAYDDDIGTYASFTLPGYGVTSLQFMRDPPYPQGDRIRYFIDRTSSYINSVQVQIYNPDNQTWCIVYDGPGTWNEWVNVTFSDTRMGGMLFSFTNNGAYSHEVRIHEVDFLNAPIIEQTKLYIYHYGFYDVEIDKINTIDNSYNASQVTLQNVTGGEINYFEPGEFSVLIVPEDTAKVQLVSTDAGVWTWLTPGSFYSFACYGDSWVDSANPDANMGSDPKLHLKNEGGAEVRTSYLKFNLSDLPSDAQIISARVKLYCNQDDGAGTTNIPVYLYAVDDSWAENTITYNNAPAKGDVVGTALVGEKNTFYVWDITSYVQTEWAGDKIVSLSMGFGSTEDHHRDWASRQANDITQYPVLEILYVVEG